VYFVSDVLAGSKKFYSKIEIFCYAIILSARKLWHYFEAHTIKVLTNQPLNDFKKHSAIKSQVLVDFVAEWMVSGSAADSEVPETPWVVYCNGAWSTIGARAVAILISPLGIKLRYAARMQFNSEVDKCTNNIAEYEAILLGLCKLRAIGILRCILHTDSKVVASQIEKECISRDPTLERYLGMARRMENYFKGFTVEYIERNKFFEAN
jgi:ribonuclease HI